jgi:hypothetical protein
MSNLANSYPIFEDNQVLTSSQLNELVTYLDEQSRLTRVKLIGMGVACGLVPVFKLNDPAFGNKTTLKITNGKGITSEGYLIAMGDCTVTRYRPYQLPASVVYPPFGTPQRAGLNFFEMLTDEAEEDVTNPSVPITQSFFGSGNSRKIVMLFIESYENDLGSCLTKACDELGRELVFTIRKLAVSKAEVDALITPSISLASEYLFPGKYDLPEVTMPRVLFDPAAQHSKNYLQFSVNYINAMKKKFNDLFTSALPATYDVFRPILSELYGTTNPLLSTTAQATLNNFINGGFTTGPKYLGMQYAYDYMKDLIMAYNEFRDTAFELMSKCCPDMGLFPKHLMLGEAIATGDSKPSKYRHYFTEAVVTRDQKYLFEKALTLHKRLVLMTQKFDLTTINNPNSTVIAPETLGESLLITPSDDKLVPLSLRAIPYYFRNDENDSTALNLGTLEKNWNYEYVRKCLADKGITPLSYNNQDTDQSAAVDQVRTPLYFDTDRFSFLRIEGHLRQKYQAVTEELERLKAQFNLPFNVVALRLQGTAPDEIRSRCNFDDLRTEYLSVRTELMTTIQPIFDRFATYNTSTGVIDMKAVSVFLKGLVDDSDITSQNVGSISDFKNAFEPYKKIRTIADSGTATLQTGIIGEKTSFTERSFEPVEELTPVPLETAFLVSPLVRPRFNLPQAITLANKRIITVHNAVQDSLKELCIRLNRLLRTQNVQNVDVTLLPFDLADFKYGAEEAISNKSFIRTWVEAMQYAINAKSWLNHLLDQLIRTPRNRNTPEMYFVLSQYCAELFAQLDKIITGSFHKRLEMVYYTMEYRINYMKANDQTLFSNFIKKHPGIEHKGGVEPGGTFVLVYNGDHVGVDLEKRKKAILSQRELTYRQKKIELAESMQVLSDSERVELVQDKQFVASVAAIKTAVATSVSTTLRIDLDKDQVIADFALPYLCCTSGECSSVPRPETITDLGIPAIAVPSYVEYKLGDYAFSKDIEVGAGTTELIIDIIQMLQYENTVSVNSIRPKLIENNMGKHYYDTTFNGTGYKNITNVWTTNAPHQVSTGQRGTASIKMLATGKHFISYTPANGFRGIDSFYYMFEITDSNGNVLKRSNIGKITVMVNSTNTQSATVSVINQTATPVIPSA